MFQIGDWQWLMADFDNTGMKLARQASDVFAEICRRLLQLIDFVP
jgi:hypothetical protein